MSINIDLGAWNSIFAVPSKVVDEGLKFSDGVKLKVLLFVLRNAGRSVDDTEISKATGVNVTDIPEALDYWVSMGVFNRIENTFTPVKITRNLFLHRRLPLKRNRHRNLFRLFYSHNRQCHSLFKRFKSL